MKLAIVHIADIHYRKEEPESASAIIKAFISDLKTQKESFSEHEFFLAVTGDIVKKGEDLDSYVELSKNIENGLDDIGITKEFRMIVPGNHDLNKSVVEKNFDYYQKAIADKCQSEPIFNNFFDSDFYKDTKFENYALFESDFAKYGIDFSNQGKGWVINKTIGVYCLNTAICSFGGANDICDDGNLAIYTRGLFDWCSSNTAPVNILLMHHPVGILNKWSKDGLRQLIEENFCLCLCGHNHEQDLYYNRISHNSLICSAPQLFTNKEDLLGYAIVLIEENSVDSIVYRQYVKGQFLNGSAFSQNNEGVVRVPSNHLEHIGYLEHELKSALAFLRGQPEVFIEPKISEDREFNDKPNMLEQIIKNPQPAIIVAHPQFGLTCLSHHMRLEAYKLGSFWIYLDAKYEKARNIEKKIDDQLNIFKKTIKDIKCIIIDSWDSGKIDHRNILKLIDDKYGEIPIIIMSNYSGFHFNSAFDFTKLKLEPTILHLQALERNKVRKLVVEYNKEKHIESEDAIVNKIVSDLSTLNVHRTPLNCLTLLKVFEREFNEELVNRTKMIKAVLFILFTDSDSFTYTSNKPDVDDCEYILGKFCKTLIEKGDRRFSYFELLTELQNYCEEKLISVNVNTIIEILESNNILLRFNEELEFKHRYWIFYFAAVYMLQDDDFKNYILGEQKYVNYPEIIEFYTGLDGRRDDAISTLLDDIKNLIQTVKHKIGIQDDFNPFDTTIWNPPEERIEEVRKDISDKVKQSKLPKKIRDQHADECYDSEAPYDQSISTFLNEYSVVSLVQAIKASSRALRNSNYVDADLKKAIMQEILNGWEQLSRVIFWLSPALAQEGIAAYEGFGLILVDELKGACSNKLEKIYLANPYNVVVLFEENLSSSKIGPLIYDNLKRNSSNLQRHLLAIYLVRQRPKGWFQEVLQFMNLLHKNSFYLGNIKDITLSEKEKSFATENDYMQLKNLLNVVLTKHKRPIKSYKAKNINKDNAINEANRVPIDEILAYGKKKIR